MKFRSIFNHDFTNRGCLYCAILKAYRARDIHFFFQNVQNKKQGQKHHTHDILILSLLLVIVML